ncbi:MAG: hypothetical protein JSV92_00570 [archaeon]|nr:MAG: hypothetical protein JSV92_00570 [archaeon]
MIFNRKGLIGSHKIKCCGINSLGNEVFDKKLAEDVIVKVYKDGHSEPLCRYNIDKEGKCDAVFNPTDEPGFCPYKTKK